MKWKYGYEHQLCKQMTFLIVFSSWTGFKLETISIDNVRRLSIYVSWNDDNYQYHFRLYSYIFFCILILIFVSISVSNGRWLSVWKYLMYGNRFIFVIQWIWIKSCRLYSNKTKFQKKGNKNKISNHELYLFISDHAPTWDTKFFAQIGWSQRIRKGSWRTCRAQQIDQKQLWITEQPSQIG